MNLSTGPLNAITDIPGLLVGHAQNPEAGTGCSVVLCPQGAVAAVDVRGGAPGTRETDCLEAANLIREAHAVYLGGGSAFGLAGAQGVMRWLEEQGAGFDTGYGRVPIVPGAVLFDLNVGRADLRPDAEMGYSACLNARADEARQGSIGAGTGASIGKAAGPERMMKGGIGTACLIAPGPGGGLMAGALAAVNCFGDVIDPHDGAIVAGTLSPDRRSFADSSLLLAASGDMDGGPFAAGVSTTLAVVAVNAALSQSQARRVAMMAQDGLARTIRPAHTLYDGDTVFCLAAGPLRADPSAAGELAAAALERAVLAAARNAESACGIPSRREIFGGPQP
jgi:L-aminopeptidase/D-esterase-like protein